MFLNDILAYFNSGVECEEVIWALCYQTSRALKKHRMLSLRHRKNCRLFVDLETVYLDTDGSIDIIDRELSKANYEEESSYQSEAELLLCIGSMIGRCIYFQLSSGEIEEKELGEDITELIGRLILLNDQYVPEDSQFFESHWMTSWSSSHFSQDESMVPTKFLSLDEVLSFCEQRCRSRDKIDISHHYQSVCADFACEATELRHFLDKTLLVNIMVGTDGDNEDIVNLQQQWAREWKRIVNSYRRSFTDQLLLASENSNNNNNNSNNSDTNDDNNSNTTTIRNKNITNSNNNDSNNNNTNSNINKNDSEYFYFGEILATMHAEISGMEEKTCVDQDFSLGNSNAVITKSLNDRLVQREQSFSPIIKPIVDRAMMLRRQKTLEDSTQTLSKLCPSRIICPVSSSYEYSNTTCSCNLILDNDLVEAGSSRNKNLPSSSQFCYHHHEVVRSNSFPNEQFPAMSNESRPATRDVCNEGAKKEIGKSCDDIRASSVAEDLKESSGETSASKSNTFVVVVPKDEVLEETNEMFALEDNAEDILYSKAGSSLVEICKIRQEITRAELDCLLTENPSRMNVKSGRACFNCQKQCFSFWHPANNCGICRRKYCSKCCLTNVEIPSHLIDVSSSEVNQNPYDLDRNRSLSWSDLANNYITPFRVKRQSWYKLKQPMRTAGPVYTLCKECKRFLDAITTEKRNRQWQVRLEMHL